MDSAWGRSSRPCWSRSFLPDLCSRRIQGTPEMQDISSAIREGAEAFMGRQYKTIAIMAVVLAAVLYAGYGLSA